MAKVAAEAESKASGRHTNSDGTPANRGATEPGAAEPGGGEGGAKEAARKVAVAETAAADLAVTKPSDAPQPLRFQLTPSDEDRKAGYLPLDVKLSLPLNPFHELLPQQHGNVAAAYGRIGWEQMRAEGEIRLADAKPKLGAEPRAENETEATPGAEPRAENPVSSRPSRTTAAVDSSGTARRWRRFANAKTRATRANRRARGERGEGDGRRARGCGESGGNGRRARRRGDDGAGKR